MHVSGVVHRRARSLQNHGVPPHMTFEIRLVDARATHPRILPRTQRPLSETCSTSVALPGFCWIGSCAPLVWWQRLQHQPPSTHTLTRPPAPVLRRTHTHTDTDTHVSGLNGWKWVVGIRPRANSDTYRGCVADVRPQLDLPFLFGPLQLRRFALARVAVLSRGSDRACRLCGGSVCSTSRRRRHSPTRPPTSTRRPTNTQTHWPNKLATRCEGTPQLRVARKQHT